jgi:hypothetical protein
LCITSGKFHSEIFKNFWSTQKKTTDMWLWIVLKYYSVWSFGFSTGHICLYSETKFCICIRYKITHVHGFISRFFENSNVWHLIMRCGHN